MEKTVTASVGDLIVHDDWLNDFAMLAIATANGPIENARRVGRIVRGLSTLRSITARDSGTYKITHTDVY